MKKIALFIFLIILVGAIWYVFIYPYDYLVTMKVKANKGTVNQMVKLWDFSLDNSEITSVQDLGKITQYFHFNLDKSRVKK